MSPPHARPLDVDVLVVGAGIAGVDVGARLGMHCPGTAWAVLESRDAVGGTWDLFRYPGIRSDSDMYTLGFPFRPWRGEASLASGEQIRQYVQDTAREFGVTERIHHGQRVERLDWSSDDARWTVTARTDAGTVRHTARLVYLATGYFSYEGGHVVDFPGQELFAGPVIHPQAWPDDLSVQGKRVVVIGSGATAVTLVPALVEAGACHVSMLQRSPSYVASVPSRDRVATRVRQVMPDAVAHRVVRAKNVVLSTLGYQVLRRYPDAGRRLLRRRMEQALPAGYPVELHFTPTYDPWDQRLCAAADGDLFTVLGDGRASVVTASIDAFEGDGIRLAGGEHVPADVIVTATGLQMEFGGGARVFIDGVEVDVSSGHVYKGLMLSDVPNLAMAVGYTNASWTLRADLSARWFCSLVRYLDRRGLSVATPRYDE
ncbi:MAG TPA: NAD(P)/FAD-dependent oxidoreductase, partial [Ornithinibacter sp.]|nr:NAD(P)/FAD-dependent oxidoreductase [Dermatophilaceae bacterium]HQZ10763.1 NAD(P)/FAD-dependent oxidoreductase [Ornithinibacter sp.]